MFQKLIDPALSTHAHPYHAHEGYTPSAVAPVNDMSYEQWTERVSVQSEFVAARELAGLSDATLQALAYHYEKAPRRKRGDWLRFSYPVAGVLGGVAAMLVMAHKAYPGQGAGLGVFELSALAAAGMAFLASAIGAASAFHDVPLRAAHVKMGHYVTKLDERHPWLYRARLLMSNEAANAYREKALRERGVLRGTDYLMMREIAMAHEAVLLTDTASHTARLVQGAETLSEPSREGAQEIRQEGAVPPQPEASA